MKEIPTSWYNLAAAYRSELQNTKAPSGKDTAAARRILLDVITTKEKLQAWFDLYFATAFPQTGTEQMALQKMERSNHSFRTTPPKEGMAPPVAELVTGDPRAESPLLSSLVDSALQWMPDMRALRNALREAQCRNLAHPHWPRIED